MVKIVWLHIPELEERMYETRDFVIMLKEMGYEIIDGITPKGIDFAIWKPLDAVWESDDIIIIGQDNVPTFKMINELEKCKHEACVNPCISYPRSTALSCNYQNQIILIDDGKSQRLLQVNERPEYVDYGGTGVCKISIETQKRIKLKEHPCSFPALDSTLFQLGLKKWHTHYPMHKHNKM